MLRSLEVETCIPNVGSQIKPGRKGTPLLVEMMVSMESVTREAPNALISLTCDRIRQLSLTSYDRFFPTKPRFISCVENCEQYIALPKGCLEAAHRLLEQNSTPIPKEGKRVLGEPIQASFTKTLQPEQREALKAMLSFDNRILHAPTASF